MIYPQSVRMQGRKWHSDAGIDTFFFAVSFRSRLGRFQFVVSQEELALVEVHLEHEVHHEHEVAAGRALFWEVEQEGIGVSGRIIRGIPTRGFKSIGRLSVRKLRRWGGQPGIPSCCSWLKRRSSS